ncbi:hypothetical protein J6590_088747 [Homalodisca vitripennis]|nr:hypothetical protein J6590_088747 [Homalodisca vitripennis]
MFVFTSIVCQPDTTTHYRAQTLLILLFLLQQFPSLSVKSAPVLNKKHLKFRHNYSLPRTNTAYPAIPASAIPELECEVCTGSQQEASEMFVFTSFVCQSDTTNHYRAQTLLILLFLLQQFPSLSVKSAPVLNKKHLKFRHNYSLPRTNTAYPAIPASVIPELECEVCTGSQQEASEMFVFTSFVCQQTQLLTTANTAYPAIPASAIPELECVVCTGSQQEASEMFVFTSFVCQSDTSTHYHAQTRIACLLIFQTRNTT